MIFSESGQLFKMEGKAAREEELAEVLRGVAGGVAVSRKMLLMTLMMRMIMVIMMVVVVVMTGDVRLFEDDGDGSGNDYDDADEDNDNDDYDGESEIVPKVKCLADSGANKTDKVLSSSS